ncbi:hypothetical protein D9M68_634520 [compost metagenome]
MAHGGGEVGGADEHAVDAFHGGDRIQVGQAVEVLDLHQQAHLLVGVIQVAGDAVPARGAGQGAADATDAVGRVAHGAHQFGSLLGGFHHGHQQGLRADIQQLLDQHRVADGRTDDRLGRVGRDGLELGQQAAQVVGCVLAVQQQPVEAGVGRQLGAVGIGQAEPEADLRLAGMQAGLEVVDGELHGALLGWRRWKTATQFSTLRGWM